MCGFVGFTGAQPVAEKEAILAPMMQRIFHRGPDMGSHYADECVGLGFRRLSILDLRQEAAQPMPNEDGSVRLVFNGEIYNYKALREELQGKGHVFRSRADSEVLVHGWEEWKEGLVARLRGMFAFVVWDVKSRTMLAARDPFGIKPFYYSHLPGGGLLFGSEIKSFLDYPGFEKAVNPDALAPYLSFQYAAGRDTFFKGVHCLPQGHYAIWREGRWEETSYWDAAFAPEEQLSFNECIEAIDAAVHESVKAHCISDVPVGSFLSGGVDSSYITATLMPENTFSVGFADENFDESGYAAELSRRLGVKNFRRMLSAEECFEAFPDIQYHMDQPQSNPSSVPLWFLAQLAREQVTVVLSGEGADELFAGYELYADTPAMARFKRLPAGLRRALGGAAHALPPFKGRNFLMKSSGRPEDWFIGQADVFPQGQARSVLREGWRGGPEPLAMAAPYYRRAAGWDEVKRKQYLDMNLWMPGDILLKADKMCMAHSLELRVPFLDKEMFALAARIPTRHLVQGVQSKLVFRHAANKTLPDEWATRPKKGFPVPIRNWLREPRWQEHVRGHFTAPWAGEFFDSAALCRLLDEHGAGRANNGRKIWTVFTFLTWYKRFFIDWETHA